MSKTLFETVAETIKSPITTENVDNRLAYVKDCLQDKELGGETINHKNLSALRKKQGRGPQVWILDPVFRTKRNTYDMKKAQEILTGAKETFAKKIKETPKPQAK